MKIVHRAGTSVIDKSAAAARASDFVAASGRNIRPSAPSSANTGRNDSSMINTEKKIGRPIFRHAAETIRRVSPTTGRSPKRCSRACMAFSAMTMATSTSTPIETTIPANDMTLV